MPEDIRSYKDLELVNDTSITNYDKLILDINNERQHLDIQLQQMKKKRMIDTITIVRESEKTGGELKNIHKTYTSIQNERILKDKNRYTNIIQELKNQNIYND